MFSFFLDLKLPLRCIYKKNREARISFEDKDLSEEQIQAKFKEEYQWLKETQE